VKYDPPLLPARLVRRYKRFLADVDLGGWIETVHCANPGSMLGLAEPGARVWLSRSPKPDRKLPLTWELVEAGGNLVGINTGLANRLAEEAIRAGQIGGLAGYETLRREVPYGEASRVDFLLSGPGRPDCYVEVKSVTLARGQAAEFPDSVTARGLRHLDELCRIRSRGARAVMLFLAQRADCTHFATADDIDPAYGAGLSRARAGGVEVLVHACRVDPGGIEVAGPLPLAPLRGRASPLQNGRPGT